METNDTVILPWAEAGIQEFRRILRETWLDTYAGFIPVDDILSYLDRVYAPSEIGKMISDQNQEGYFARINGADVAVMRLHREEEKFHLTSLYVLPSVQGRRVGQSLLEFAAGRAKSNGFDKLWLGVMSKNLQAVIWYERRGLVVCERQPFTMGTSVVDHLIGYLPLDTIFGSNRPKHF